MKKFFYMLLIVAVFIIRDSTAQNRYYKKHENAVNRQHSLDMKNRDAILKELKAFLDDTNKELGEPGLKMETPVKENSIAGIKETDHVHYSGVIPPKIYGYVNTGTLNMRAEDSSRSEIVGKLNFRERVEIVLQSDLVEEIRGMKSPWLLVRRANGDEGWVFGGYVSDNIPSEEDKESGKTDWGMIMPAEGRLSSRFGKRVDPVSKRRYSDHKGIDIAAPEGTPVYASESGNVARAEFVRNGYGNLIVIKHADDVATYYGHLSKILVRSGNPVNKGDLIGKVGSTGRSTGPHLHFEVRRGERALDPEGFVR